MKKRIFFILLAICALPILWTSFEGGASLMVWNGVSQRPVTVHVTGSDGLGIAGARVVYAHAYDYLADSNYVFSAKTDSTGSVSFWGRFPATGMRLFYFYFHSVGHYTLTNSIRVEAAGYHPFEAPLASLGVPRPRLRDTNVTLTVRLEKQ